MTEGKKGVQLILRDGQPEYAVVPYEQYRHLVEAAEMLADVAAYDDVRLRLAAGSEELLPAAIVNRLLTGETPLRIWREHRGLSQKALAAQAGISAGYLSQLESGRRAGRGKVLSRLAEALGVTVDDLLT